MVLAAINGVWNVSCKLRVLGLQESPKTKKVCISTFWEDSKKIIRFWRSLRLDGKIRMMNIFCFTKSSTHPFRSASVKIWCFFRTLHINIKKYKETSVWAVSSRSKRPAIKNKLTFDFLLYFVKISPHFQFKAVWRKSAGIEFP